jgi:hypothetical protein
MDWGCASPHGKIAEACSSITLEKPFDLAGRDQPRDSDRSARGLHGMREYAACPLANSGILGQGKIASLQPSAFAWP